MRPGHSVRPKIRLTESGTDLITILRCFLSFKTALTSRNIIVFNIFFSPARNGHPSRARSLVPSAASCIMPGDPGGVMMEQSHTTRDPGSMTMEQSNTTRRSRRNDDGTEQHYSDYPEIEVE